LQRAKQHQIAFPAAFVLYRLQDSRVEREVKAPVREQEIEKARARVLQAPGAGRGEVINLADGAFDPRAKIGMNTRIVIDDSRDARNASSRLPSDILNGGLLPAIPLTRAWQLDLLISFPNCL